MAGYLVTFGCSWAHGEGDLRDQELQYSRLLSQALDRQLIDLSEPSTSIAHLILQFRQFVTDHYRAGEDYLAVFMITAQERSLAFDSLGQAVEIHPSRPEYRAYYESIYTDQLGAFTANTVVMTLQALCRLYGINDRYILGWQDLELWPEIDLDRFYKQGRTTAMQLLGLDTITQCRTTANPNFIPNNGHPSAAGHAVIARALAEWIAQ